MKSTRIRTSPSREVRLWCRTIFLVTTQLSRLILRQQHEAFRQPRSCKLGTGGAADSQMSECLRRALLLLVKERRPEHFADWPWEQDRGEIQKDKVHHTHRSWERHSRATWKITHVVTGRREEERMGLHLYRCAESKIGQVKGQHWLIWSISKGLGLIGMVL